AEVQAGNAEGGAPSGLYGAWFSLGGSMSTLPAPLCTTPAAPADDIRQRQHLQATHLVAESSQVEHGTVRSPPRSPRPTKPAATTLCLQQAILPPATAVSWEINQDIVTDALKGHCLADLQIELPESVAQTAWGRIWNRLPTILPCQPLQALYLFTDGSYYPGKRQASWAVIVLVLQNNQVYKAGILAGPCALQPDADAGHFPSAYDGELEALLHALAIGASAPVCACHFGSDCQSALTAAFGFSGHQQGALLPAAAVGLTATLVAQGKQLYPHKVEAHHGCAFNSLADEVAKFAGKTGQCLPATAEWDTLHAAINEKVLERAWLTVPSSIFANTLPPLREDGTWSAPNTLIRSSAPNALPPYLQRIKEDVQAIPLRLRLLTYNALSVRGATAKALICSGLLRHQIDLAGLQETRDRAQGVSSCEDYWVLASPCDKGGHFGVQIWLRKAAGWDRTSFAITHSDPRVLVAVCSLRGVRLVLICAHAPTSATSEEELTRWWAHLKSLLAKIPKVCAPLLFIDANARFEASSSHGRTLESAPSNFNAKCLQHFANDIGLHISAQQDEQGRPLHSWRSPKGTTSLIDYVGCPVAWADGHRTVGNVDLADLHADWDHLPIHTCLAATVEAVTTPARSRVAPKDLQSDEGRSRAIHAVAAAPLVPWTATCTSHVDALQGSMVQALSHSKPDSSPGPRNPVISQATLGLVRLRRHMRRCLRPVDRRADMGFLHLCLQAWRQRTQPQEELYRQAKSARLAMARSYHGLAVLNKQLRQAMMDDRAQFARLQMEQARHAGPAEFAHRLRAILRTGRKFRPPPLLPALSKEPTVRADWL
ncbi:unnamed protein product, partial [Symbiodinium sp. CCMP2456]